MREVLFVAGEPSGALHGAGVAVELRRAAPGIPLTGIGGARMEAAGVTLLEHTDRLAVMGFLIEIAAVPNRFDFRDERLANEFVRVFGGLNAHVRKPRRGWSIISPAPTTAPRKTVSPLLM